METLKIRLSTCFLEYFTVLLQNCFVELEIKLIIFKPSAQLLAENRQFEKLEGGLGI